MWDYCSTSSSSDNLVDDLPLASNQLPVECDHEDPWTKPLWKRIWSICWETLENMSHLKVRYNNKVLNTLMNLPNFEGGELKKTIKDYKKKNAWCRHRFFW